MRYGGLLFLLRARAVEGIDRFSTLVQGNVTARNLLVPEIFGYELHQDAITAWLCQLSAVEIQTGRRILKHKLRAPSGSRGVVITGIFQELQFGLQHLQHVSLVDCHERNPLAPLGLRTAGRLTVTNITCFCADGHIGPCVARVSRTSTLRYAVSSWSCHAALFDASSSGQSGLGKS